MSIDNKGEAKDTFSDLMKMLSHDEVAVVTEMLADFRESKELQLRAQIVLRFENGLFKGYEHVKSRKTTI